MEDGSSSEEEHDTFTKKKLYNHLPKPRYKAFTPKYEPDRTVLKPKARQVITDQTLQEITTSLVSQEDDKVGVYQKLPRSKSIERENIVRRLNQKNVEYLRDRGKDNTFAQRWSTAISPERRQAIDVFVKIARSETVVPIPLPTDATHFSNLIVPEIALIHQKKLQEEFYKDIEYAVRDTEYLWPTGEKVIKDDTHILQPIFGDQRVFLRGFSYGMGSGIETVLPELSIMDFSEPAPLTLGLLKKIKILVRLIVPTSDIDFFISPLKNLALNKHMRCLPTNEYITWILLRSFPIFNLVLLTTDKTSWKRFTNFKNFSIPISPKYADASKKGTAWLFDNKELMWYNVFYNVFRSWNRKNLDISTMANFCRRFYKKENVEYLDFFIQYSLLFENMKSLKLSPDFWDLLFYGNFIFDKEVPTDSLVLYFLSGLDQSVELVPS